MCKLLEKEEERGKKEGDEEAEEEEEGRGRWKGGVTSVKTNVGRWPGLCRLQKNVPTSARRL